VQQTFITFSCLFCSRFCRQQLSRPTLWWLLCSMVGPWLVAGFLAPYILAGPQAPWLHV